MLPYEDDLITSWYFCMEFLENYLDFCLFVCFCCAVDIDIVNLSPISRFTAVRVRTVHYAPLSPAASGSLGFTFNVSNN